MDISDFKKIYNSLGDERSKNIFFNRFMYSVSADKKYIRKMIDDEIEYYSNNDQMFQLFQWLESRKGKIVVFGAGFAGTCVVETLKHKSISVDLICDNNKYTWGRMISGIRVGSPDEIDVSEQLSIIIGVNSARDIIYSQLIGMGIDNSCIFLPKNDWWMGNYPQYFDEEIVKPEKIEFFVDGGALDGNDSINFIKWCNERYSSILALEPDKDNCVKTEKNLENYSKVKVFEKGLWDSSTTLKFSSGKSENSLISDTGDIEIQTVSIDEIESEYPISFIKMDIEGSEARALLGSRKTIEKHHPKLAICVYHKPEDIIELPLLVLEMYPGYKIYFRHYSYTDTETVMYAVSEKNSW